MEIGKLIEYKKRNRNRADIESGKKVLYKIVLSPLVFICFGGPRFWNITKTNLSYFRLWIQVYGEF